MRAQWVQVYDLFFCVKTSANTSNHSKSFFSGNPPPKARWTLLVASPISHAISVVRHYTMKTQPLTQLILQQAQDVNVARFVGQPTGVHAATAAAQGSTGAVAVATAGTIAVTATVAIAVTVAPPGAATAATARRSIIVIV